MGLWAPSRILQGSLGSFCLSFGEGLVSIPRGLFYSIVECLALKASSRLSCPVTFEPLIS